jgi:uncharacterized protein
MMAGESNLNVLLKNLRPVLQPGEYVFCQVPAGQSLGFVRPLGAFYEEEGLSVIIEREEAERRGWPVDYVAAWISLHVHSDLAAVGLTAAVSTALAGAGISCNVVAATLHDHLFVPIERAEEAMKILQKLAETE